MSRRFRIWAGVGVYGLRAVRGFCHEAILRVDVVARRIRLVDVLARLRERRELARRVTALVGARRVTGRADVIVVTLRHVGDPESRDLLRRFVGVDDRTTVFRPVQVDERQPVSFVRAESRQTEVADLIRAVRGHGEFVMNRDLARAVDVHEER